MLRQQFSESRCVNDEELLLQSGSGSSSRCRCRSTPVTACAYQSVGRATYLFFNLQLRRVGRLRWCFALGVGLKNDLCDRHAIASVRGIRITSLAGERFAHKETGGEVVYETSPH